jgi:hypothetical protein
MAEEPIRKEDIIDLQGTQDSINELIKTLENLSSVMRNDLKVAADELQKSLQGVNVATKEGQEKVKAASATAENLAAQQKEQNRLDKERIQLQARLAALNTDEAQQIQLLKVAVENKNKAMKEAARLDDSAAGSVNKMRSKLKELTAEYNKLGASARKEVAPAINKLTDELKKAESAIGNNTRNVGNYKSAWSGAGKTILAAAGFVGGATMALRSLFNVIKGGFKTSIDFEYAMSQVKAVANASSTEFEALKQSAITLGAATRYTSTEVAGLQKEYAKLGFTAPEILKITAATLDLAAATGTDLSFAATIAGATLRQFGLGAHEMQRVVDVMTLSFSQSALDMDKFATAMQHAGPVAKAVGETIESTSAKLAVLANSGLDASIAGTSLRNIYLELERRGLTWDQAMNKINSSQQKASMSLELFGKRGAVAGVILADNTELANQFTESFNNADGSAKKMADTMLDNVKGSAIILKSAWEGLILRTNQSNGALKSVIDTLTDLVTAINTKGKPAIDSMFETRQIDDFSDKWKFYASQGIGFFATLGNSVFRSKEQTQEFSDTLSDIMEKQKAKDFEMESHKAALAAEEKRRNDERLQQIQASIDAAELAAKANEKEQKTFIENSKNRNKWLDSILNSQISAKEKEKKLEEDYKKIIGVNNADKLKVNKEWLASQQAAIKYANDTQIDDLIATEQKKQNIISESFSIISGSITQLSDLYQTQKEKELSAAGDNAEQREAIERKYAKKQQILSIGQALINGALAVTEIQKKWAAFPPIAAMFTALTVASTLAQVAIIKSQKFAKGGSGVLFGPSHASGGINVGIGEAEGGEHLAITSRKMTSKYGSKMLDAVSNSINQGRFFEVWANVNKEMGVSDPYTKKMYDLMTKTPTVYTDTNGNTVKEYPNGQKYVIRKIWKN